MLERNDRANQLFQVLGTLSPKRQAVVLMHRRDGMTCQEIAARLNLSVAMVKKHLARGLAECHKQMNGLAPGQVEAHPIESMQPGQEG